MRKTGSCVVMVALMLGLATGMAGAKAPIYKWVKDKQVSSEDVLLKSKTTRLVPLQETSALDCVKQVMAEDLYMALAEYHATKHQQDAETNPDTVLPEEITRQATAVDLMDEDYRFILEVTLKKVGQRTRVTAKASPVYRIHDADAEAAQAEEGSGETSVEVKVRADSGSAVGVGPIFIAPLIGLPADYGINPLTDASGRSGQLVKAFMYLLDKRVAKSKGAAKPAPTATAVPVAVEAQPAEAAPEAAPAEGTPGVEVDITVKQKK